MPKAARERGYEPRPQEPHLLRLRERLEKRPSSEQDSPYVTTMVTNVKGDVAKSGTIVIIVIAGLEDCVALQFSL
jgi:hypothetical protein